MTKKLLCTCFLSLLFAQTLTAAELVVIASNVDSIPAGEILDSAESIVLQPGEQISLVSASSERFKLNGPHKGSIGASAEEGKHDVFTVIAELFKRQESNKLAAFRSSPGNKYAKPSIWHIHVGLPGNVCVPTDSRPSLWRADSKHQTMLSVYRNGELSGEVEWPAKEHSLPWPSFVTLENSLKLTLVTDQPALVNPIVLKLMPANLKDEFVQAVWLARNRCDRQSLDLLSRL